MNHLACDLNDTGIRRISLFDEKQFLHLRVDVDGHAAHFSGGGGGPGLTIPGMPRGR